jgi:hypothetical protein
MYSPAGIFIIPSVELFPWIIIEVSVLAEKREGILLSHEIVSGCSACLLLLLPELHANKKTTATRQKNKPYR